MIYEITTKIESMQALQVLSALKAKIRLFIDFNLKTFCFAKWAFTFDLIFTSK
jgi:hypothetical protein